MSRPLSWTLGPWTSRRPVTTEDELNYNVAMYAVHQGWKLPPIQLSMLERWRAQLDDSPLNGEGVLREPAERGALRLLAHRAVAHLNTLAPAGRRLVFTDGLYCLADDQPDSDACQVKYPQTSTGRRAMQAGHVNPPRSNVPEWAAQLAAEEAFDRAAFAAGRWIPGPRPLRFTVPVPTDTGAWSTAA